jgi:hypothetical protein
VDEFFSFDPLDLMGHEVFGEEGVGVEFHKRGIGVLE